MPWQDGDFDSDPRVAEILAIVAKEAAVDRAKLKRDATIEELGIDSLDLTMTVFQLEVVFDINIPAIADQAGAEFGTVGDLVRHVIAAIDKIGRENRGDCRTDPREQPAPEVTGASS